MAGRSLVGEASGAVTVHQTLEIGYMPVTPEAQSVTAPPGVSNTCGGTTQPISGASAPVTKAEPIQVAAASRPSVFFSLGMPLPLSSICARCRTPPETRRIARRAAV